MQAFDDAKVDMHQGELLEEITIGNEVFYKISNVDTMDPFFMSIVSDSDHWMFIASNGGITAGRKNAEYALFPYYTHDKVTESAEQTGSKTIIRLEHHDKLQVWEPFSARSEAVYNCQRNLYKNRYGNKVIFEELNHDLGLLYRYEWNNSDRFGFVKRATLHNTSSDSREVEVLDGLQNLMPYGIAADMQATTSNLGDAYKRSELLPEVGLGIFALSAIIVDKAEPSEALKANTVWSVGLPAPSYLLSAAQLPAYRKGRPLRQETDVKGEKGAYFVHSRLSLAAGQAQQWMTVADVNKTQAAVIQLAEALRSGADSLAAEVLASVEEGTRKLIGLVAAADGLQYSEDALGAARHFSNTLFNIMRGGIFDDGYTVEKQDLLSYFKLANKAAYEKMSAYCASLPDSFPVFTLRHLAAQSSDADIVRLATEYLPLKFSRRHGDPSRPWNKFTINTRNELDGSKVLDYEGNWRDIFQNWEALAFSYPAFVEGMIAKFLNASTFDGYNPYRVTKAGFDWETIEPDNPWSYIGYWGDHQVIYLLKFLEFANKYYPALLPRLLDEPVFVYAHVPYHIKAYQHILANPKDTIEYSHTAEKALLQRKAAIGADGALLTNQTGSIQRANFTEKLLAMLLAKLTNLVPEGGIWMNTQRPEWNDANNALVGNGLSMVTLYYIRRFLSGIRPLLAAKENAEVILSAEMQHYFSEVAAVYDRFAAQAAASLSGRQKKEMLDALGEAAGHYRATVYAQQFSGMQASTSYAAIVRFIDAALMIVEQSIAANKRTDGLYHTYNLLSYDASQLYISHLDEMLEGQVAILSSGYLSASAAADLLDALRSSALYRPDQDSYILYPNKQLPGFLKKNNVPANAVAENALLQKLLQAGHAGIIEKDVLGGYHFNGNFRNANDLEKALKALPTEWQTHVQQDAGRVLQLFEQVFNHKAFTGRSGTFFAYEGLGSIYWHMVSKLLLAVQEVFEAASAAGQTDETTMHRLKQHFHAIKEGIGVHKSPRLYGAFPTDPYSHTPLGKGAQQPGMTGQVKEDIISRIGELGIRVSGGQFSFQPQLLRKDELLQAPQTVQIINQQGQAVQLEMPKGSLLFTLCQVPVRYLPAEQPGIQLTYGDGSTKTDSLPVIDPEDAEKIFGRSGEVTQVDVYIQPTNLHF